MYHTYTQENSVTSNSKGCLELGAYAASEQRTIDW